MQKFYLKCFLIAIATQLFMQKFVAPAIVSRNDTIAGIATFTGMAWMLVVGIMIGRIWMNIHGKSPEPKIHPYQDLIDMEDPPPKEKDK